MGNLMCPILMKVLTRGIQHGGLPPNIWIKEANGGKLMHIAHMKNQSWKCPCKGKFGQLMCTNFFTKKGDHSSTKEHGLMSYPTIIKMAKDDTHSPLEDQNPKCPKAWDKIGQLMGIILSHKIKRKSLIHENDGGWPIKHPKKSSRSYSCME